MLSLENLSSKILEQWSRTTDVIIVSVKNDMSICQYNENFTIYAKKFSNISDLITYTHKSKFISQINECIQNRSIVSFQTNLSYDNTDVEDIPSTYNITMQYLGEDNIIIIAEARPSLSHNEAKSYFAMINDYSAISRKLQKSEYYLDKKNLDLREKMREIEYHASYDDLTKVYNRRRIFEEMDKEYSKFKRLDNIFSIAMIDIDDFKQVNDTYGHQSGDIVLSTLTQLLSSMLRDYDSIGRFGGEEFLLIFPNVNLASSKLLLERMLEKVSNYNIILKDNKTVNITFSAGTAQITPDISTSELIANADKRLYEAKEHGKKRVY